MSCHRERKYAGFSVEDDSGLKKGNLCSAGLLNATGVWKLEDSTPENFAGLPDL